MHRVHIRNRGFCGSGGGNFGSGDGGVEGLLRRVAVFDDDVLHGLVPDAAGVNDGAGADSVEDGLGAGVDALGVLDDVGAGDAHISDAAAVEAGGASVAIDGAAIGKSVVGGDGGAGAPVEEVVFDLEAVCVVADDAFAGVAGELRGDALIGRGGGRKFDE